MLRLRTACLLFVAFATWGCGGPQPSAAPEPAPGEPAGAPAEPAAAPAEAAPSDSGEAAASEATPPAAEPAAPAPAAAEERDPNAPREVRYIQSPEGLKVELSGVRFLVVAKSIKVGGGFGVRVSLSAESIDQKPHSLLVTERGPIAMAGSVERKGGKRTSFGDERKGDAEQTIAPGKSAEFFREWPPKGVTPLANGESVELDLGLWGVGDAAATRRPLKQLARVKARVEAWKGKATAEPPPNIGK